MAALTRWVLAHRRLVAGAWLLLALAGAASTTRIGDALERRFDAPGREGFEVNREILAATGAGGALTPLVLVAGDGAGDPDAAFARVAEAVPGGRLLADPPLAGDPDVRIALLFVPRPPSGLDENPQATAAAERAGEAAGVGVTGVGPLNDAGGAQGGGPTLLVEILLGAAAALAILAWVFASLLALVPLLIAAVSILTTFLILLGLAQLTEVSFVVQFLVGLIGLGVAIDYSLFVVSRWREERADGLDGEAAVVRTMETAGHAIVVSGTTVAIGLLALVVVPVPAIRSIGFGGLLIPLVSTLATITLLPGLLLRFGPRLARRNATRGIGANRGWTAWARRVVAHPWPAAAAGLAVLVALAAAALSLRPGEPAVDALATSGPARAALQELERSGVGPGALTPLELLAPAAEAGALAERLRAVEGVESAVAPDGDAWAVGDRRIVVAIPHDDAATGAGSATLDRIRDAAGDRAEIGGRIAQTRDITRAIYAAFPWMFALIAVLTFALLMRALRSWLLPLKAVLLNVLSIGAAWGVVVLVWQRGGLSEAIWGIPATDAITNWIPLAIFAFLYGLSMDYEVFILSRVREGWDATGSTREAVVFGLGRTGRLVTSAALILVCAFVALAASPGTEIKILATGLAVGILLDATVVRALVVPALVMLLGRLNWVLPPGLARLVRARPSPRETGVSRSAGGR